jgi:hypothetical protein
MMRTIQFLIFALLTEIIIASNRGKFKIKNDYFEQYGGEPWSDFIRCMQETFKGEHEPHPFIGYKIVY